MHVAWVKFIFSTNILFWKSLLECETMGLIKIQTVKFEIVNQEKLTPFQTQFNQKLDIAKTESCLPHMAWVYDKD